MGITKRNKRFDIRRAEAHLWNSNGAGITRFFNALSILFPEGERYFIRSVRAYKGSTPIYLKQDVSDFIGQEAFHGREHAILNEYLESDSFENVLRGFLGGLSNNLPKHINLAATCALEHITAVLAQVLLDNPWMLGGEGTCEQEEYKNLWLWHALEETEHKAVTFDLYKHHHQGVYYYFIRCLALVLSTVLLSSVLVERYLRMSGRKHLTALGVMRTIGFIAGRKGFFWKALPMWLDWFNKDFHPWNHDNRHRLKEYEDFLNEGS